MIHSYFSLKGDRHPIPCKLYYGEDTTCVKRVVLGVHGFCGDMESSALAMLAQAMVPHDGVVLCFDFPAHGSSPADGNAFTIDDCKNDFLAVAEHIRRTYPHADYGLFATSFGGYIALLCAGDIPEFRIALRAPAVPFADVLLKNVLRISREEFERTGTVTCGFERKIDVSFAAYRRFADNDISAQVYKRPLLIFHGTQDEVVPYDQIAAFCARQPNARLVTIEDGDHRFKSSGDMECVLSETVTYYLSE